MIRYGSTLLVQLSYFTANCFCSIDFHLAFFMSEPFGSNRKLNSLQHIRSPWNKPQEEAKKQSSILNNKK